MKKNVLTHRPISLYIYELFYDHAPGEFLNVCSIWNHINVFHIPITTQDNIIIPINSVMIK